MRLFSTLARFARPAQGCGPAGCHDLGPCAWAFRSAPAGSGPRKIIGQVRRGRGSRAGQRLFQPGPVLGRDQPGPCSAASQVPGIEVGTAVTPTYPRHPLALASQALTAQAATGNRFTLGIGPSHRPIIEEQFGCSYDRPARHVREYLSALMPLLRGEQADFRGEVITAAGRWRCPAPAALGAAGRARAGHARDRGRARRRHGDGVDRTASRSPITSRPPSPGRPRRRAPARASSRTSS